jgi:glycosyltransferase involved in cell wall biosynthesis
VKISILSAVRNEALYIEEMINSVKAQDHAEWELLFVDDGSDDSTVERILAHADQDPRIRLVSAEGSVGKVAAFNLAFRAARGDLIVLAAGDDRLADGSLTARRQAMEDCRRTDRAVGFFKIRTFSKDRRFDGALLPKGSGGSRSGGSLTMTHCLADEVFPIDSSLVAEDIWLGFLAERLASKVIDRNDVVLEYRIHPGNSNPRHQPFAEMSRAMHARHRAWDAMASTNRFNLPDHVRAELVALWNAEMLRYNGKTIRILLAPGLSLPRRLSLASMSHPSIFSLRAQFFRILSGRMRQ